MPPGAPRPSAGTRATQGSDTGVRAQRLTTAPLVQGCGVCVGAKGQLTCLLGRQTCKITAETLIYILSEGDICVQILRTPTRDDRTRAGQKTALQVPPAGGQARDTRATRHVLVVSGGPAYACTWYPGSDGDTEAARVLFGTRKTNGLPGRGSRVTAVHLYRRPSKRKKQKRKNTHREASR